MNPDSHPADETLLVACFRLGEAVFGIDAQSIQEVARVGDVTQVHHAPADVVGIRNLRGRVITVIDLRRRLGLGRVDASPDNRVLIVDWQGEPVGLLVDLVTDMVTTDPAALAPPPPNLQGVSGRHLRGICHAGGRLVAVLNHQTLLQPEESGTAGPGPAAPSA